MASMDFISPEAEDGYAGCFHILRVIGGGIRSKPALHRCYRSRSAAETAKRRGLSGDRSRDGDHLLPHSPDNPLAVVRCKKGCPCVTWRTGCNGTNLPPPPPEQRYLRCDRCRFLWRNVREQTDPTDEVPRLHCEACAGKFALKLSVKRRVAVTVKRHADDPAMQFLIEWARPPQGRRPRRD